MADSARRVKRREPVEKQIPRRKKNGLPEDAREPVAFAEAEENQCLRILAQVNGIAELEPK